MQDGGGERGEAIEPGFSCSSFSTITNITRLSLLVFEREYG